ncbi:MAG: hypothetical protein C4576_33805 [Desulfobacteraceae bacterium]|nr:MAG: hypothetical protein C4576_33805 [Desulfobacteraceae bacterium]
MVNRMIQSQLTAPEAMMYKSQVLALSRFHPHFPSRRIHAFSEEKFDFFNSSKRIENAKQGI